MFDPTRFMLFLTAALLLAITPGPGILYVLARSLAGGRREGILSSFGTLLGGLVHVFAAAAGVSAILATSAIAFSVVKYAGAAYLVYLGVRMILTRKEAAQEVTTAAPTGNAFIQGIVTEVLNPKTAIFFLSFIPQFVDSRTGSVFTQFVVLGVISVVLNTAADVVVAVFAGSMGRRLLSSVRARERQRAGTGAVMIGLGAYVAAADAS